MKWEKIEAGDATIYQSDTLIITPMQTTTQRGAEVRGWCLSSNNKILGPPGGFRTITDAKAFADRYNGERRPGATRKRKRNYTIGAETDTILKRQPNASGYLCELVRFFDDLYRQAITEKNNRNGKLARKIVAWAERQDYQG